MRREIIQSTDYEVAVKAANLFSNNRLIDEIEDEIESARLFTNSLRSLDVYAPTKKLLEDTIRSDSGVSGLHDLKSAVDGLNFLIAARYHPTNNDHRTLPALLQYHLAWTLVENSLQKLGAESSEAEQIHANFVKSITSVVSGNGVHVVNWKTSLPQSTTLYNKVGLEISRLCAGESVGVYTVKVKGEGSVPHHSHSFLEEHHFFPEPIEGIHQTGTNGARCIESDIVYIGHGTIHAFRNDEEEDRTFLFICGSHKTGPWDFVQDITSYPGYEFPNENRLKKSVRGVNGVPLTGLISHLQTAKGNGEYHRKRLSPSGMPLDHDVVVVDGTYEVRNSAEDVQIFVAQGSGELEMAGREAELKSGDVFVANSSLPIKITNTSNLALYEFVLA